MKYVAPTAAQIRRAGALAGKFRTQPERLRGYLDLSREEQSACFPGEGFGEGADWARVGELALTYLQHGKFVL